jgi:hypothetical protein
MNALRVYGCGALLFNTSSNVGLPPGDKAPAWPLGTAKLIGLVGLDSSPDIVYSFSMIPFGATGASRGEVSGVYGQTTDETTGCVFLVIIALSLLGTPRPLLGYLVRDMQTNSERQLDRLRGVTVPAPFHCCPARVRRWAGRKAGPFSPALGSGFSSAILFRKARWIG